MANQHCREVLVSIRGAGGIGDAILATPVLYAIKQKFPNSKLSLMVSPAVLNIVEGLPFVDEVINYHKHQHSIWSVVKRVWRYDVAICLDQMYRTALIAFLAGITIRAGVKHKRGWLLTHGIELDPTDENVYQPYYYAEIIKQTIGLEFENELTQLHVAPSTASDKEYVDKMLMQSSDQLRQSYIVVAPFTAWDAKDWPVEYYRQLFTKIKNNYNNVNIVLIGSNSDIPKSSQFDGVINCVGKTTLRQMAELIRRARLFIGGCSAPIHIAAAVDTPIIGLYGPTSPEHWAPRNKNTSILVSKRHCSPCDGRLLVCPHNNECMHGICIDDVYQRYVKIVGPSMGGNEG